MHGNNPDTDSLPGQGDELDRGTGRGASGGALGGDAESPHDKVTVKDDEFARPENDRSPLT